jgi:hypothetical protein
VTDAAQIADRYIAVWNETDHARRRALLAEGWADNATYVEPVMSVEGREQIGALIAAVHERFPGFRFKLEGRADGYQDRVRFSWALGSDADADLVKGTDFVVIENGRLKSVTGFLDKVPAAV